MTATQAGRLGPGDQVLDQGPAAPALPPFPPLRSGRHAAAPGALEDEPSNDTAQTAATRPPDDAPAQHRVRADHLFDPDTPVTTQTVGALVDQARAQAANPQFDGTAGRRPVGAGLWLAWDDAGDRPVIAPSGGVLVIAAADGDDRIGVARDSVSGALYAWDIDQGAPWIDSDGLPVQIDAGTLRAHAGTGDGFSALDLAITRAVETEVQALATADEESLPGVVANIDALIADLEDPGHPLHDMTAPFAAAAQEAIPLIAGAARWGRSTERRAAQQTLDRFLSLLRTGIDDPTRLAEIRDPARAPNPADPTRNANTTRGDADTQDTYTVDLGSQVAAGFHIMNDAEPYTGTAPESPMGQNADPDASGIRPSEGVAIMDVSAADGTAFSSPSPLQSITNTARPLAANQIEEWIDAASDSESAPEQVDGEPKPGFRRSQDDLIVLWDETSDSPLLSENGGYLVGTHQAPGSRFAIVRDTRLNLLRLWDLEAGQIHAWPDGSLAYLEPQGSLATLMPPEFQAELQGVALGILDYVHAENRDAANRALRELTQTLSGIESGSPFSRVLLSGVEPIVDSLLVSHTDNWQQDPTGRLQQSRLNELAANARSLLDPEYWRTRLQHHLDNHSDVSAALFEAFSASSTVRAVERTEGDLVEFYNASGNVFLILPRRFGSSLLLASQGPAFVEALSESGFSMQSQANPTTERLPGFDGDELDPLVDLTHGIISSDPFMIAQSTVIAINALQPWFLDRDKAKEYLTFIAEMTLDTLPIIGNARSYEYFEEDVRQFIIAVNEGNWSDAAIAGFVGTLDAIGTVPVVGAPAQALSSAIRKTLRQIPGARAFYMRGSGRALEPNRLTDFLSDEFLSQFDPETLKAAQRALQYAIGSAAEIGARLRRGSLLHTFGTEQFTSFVVASGKPLRAQHDVRSYRNVLGDFMNSLGANVPDSVIIEIKTGAARLSRNQSAISKMAENGIVDGDGLTFAFHAGWISVNRIPRDVLRQRFSVFFKRYVKDEQAREMFLDALYESFADIPFDFVADAFTRMSGFAIGTVAAADLSAATLGDQNQLELSSGGLSHQ